MTRRPYQQPRMSLTTVATGRHLLTTSPGMPTDNGDGTISWGSPGGSFGEDEEIASRRGSLWGDDE